MVPNKAPTAFAYYPLSFALPDSGSKVVQSAVDQVAELKKNGKLPPGLEEQYDLQLKALQDSAVPDCQFICGYGLTAALGLSHPLRSKLPDSCVQARLNLERRTCLLLCLQTIHSREAPSYVPNFHFEIS